jgi:hypothetical protein
MSRRPILVSLSSLLIAALVVIGCGSTPTPAPASQPPAATQAPAATEAPAAAAPAPTEVPAAVEVQPATGETRDVPRERTFISQGWDFYNQVPSPTNFNPYAGVTLHRPPERVRTSHPRRSCPAPHLASFRNESPPLDPLDRSPLMAFAPGCTLAALVVYSRFMNPGAEPVSTPVFQRTFLAAPVVN